MYSLDDIESRSYSKREMVVEYIDAMELLDIYERNNIKVIGWEGWIKYSNGSLGHSKKHMGTSDLSAMPNLSALSLIKSTIIQAHTEWELIPEFGRFIIVVLPYNRFITILFFTRKRLIVVQAFVNLRVSSANLCVTYQP